ncbi:MAG: hypothetical protein OHK0022_27700 [Roseiflexaceae bacterium]
MTQETRVQIRIIGQDAAEAQTAIDELRRAVGDRLQVKRPPRAGRRGQVLAYLEFAFGQAKKDGQDG